MSASNRDPLDKLAHIFTGFFNGFNVELSSQEGMDLHKMGCFGKGSSSRSRPSDRNCMIMRKRQIMKRIEWYNKFRETSTSTEWFLKDVDKLLTKIKSKDVVDLVSSGGSQSSEDNSDQEVTSAPSLTVEFTDPDNVVVVVPDSDPEGDCQQYFDDLNPECCVNPIKLNEKHILTLQEAFFLVYGLGRLQIIDKNDQILNIEQTWQLFRETDKTFIPKYVVYHYFRSKGYIVKPGIKFGGDFLLYRLSPDLAHSDFIVLIKYDNDELDWISILGHVRMANTTVKEVIVAEVVSPIEPCRMPEGLKNYTVKTSVLTRNIGTINED